MADSFADLWNSNAKPSEAPRKLGSVTSNGAQTTKKPSNDLFSMLAAPSTSASTTPRSTTPLYATPSYSKPVTPQPGAQPVQKASSGGGGGDAFSNLLTGNFSNGASNANMTIAQRAALVERQRTEQLQRTPIPVQKSSSAWEGLDALGVSSSSSIASSRSQSSQKTEDDWGFDFDTSKPVAQPAPAKPVRKVPSTSEEDDWGLGDFTTQSKPVPPTAPAATKPKSSSSIWDLDEFESSALAHDIPSIPPQPRVQPDYDDADRGDGLLQDHDGDDILGDLSRPVGAIQLSSPSPSPKPPPSGQRSRAVSPPPHIIGRIVEMGFSPQQARVALAATDSGVDVEAALEMLLSNGAGDNSPAPREPPPQQRRPEPDSDDDQPMPRRRQPTRRETGHRDTPSPAGGDTQRNIQEHADKLLAQASEIGSSLFSRANALWKESKEKVQKAYEERAATMTTGSSAPSRNGRPRWMEDANEREESERAEWSARGTGGFKDEHDDEVLPPHPTEDRKPPPEKASRQRQPTQPERPHPDQASSSSRARNLLVDDTPQVYVSPFRRKAPSRTQTQPTPPPVARNTPPRAPSPIQLVQRKTVSAAPPQLSSASKYKAAGTEMFKLGRYAEAETSYSSAIAALPPSHLLLIPLHNNRALARIRTGDHSGAIEDCTAVITLIGPTYHPSREAKVTKEDEGASVDLGDGLVKAYRRRAEAYEGKEKWDVARQDWEAIASKDWAGKVRNDAVTGIGRCRRMLTAPSDSAPAAAPATKPSAPPPRPKPKPKPLQRGPTPPSEALSRVREANQAAEAEDQAKHELKDVIDSRLIAWKGGKETNIRALIASLENVLWPELGWQKVGMHELITPNQVKIRYTKAIAKLHPDKLNVNNTTLEQRMIANGVFGALNEAWNVFKP